MSPLSLATLAVLAAAGEPNGVLLDFTATWCRPCQQMSPIVSRLEREGLPIRKVDVDQHRDLATRFKVSSIPCFVLVIDGREETRLTGSLTEEQLRALCGRIGTRPAAPNRSEIAASDNAPKRPSKAEPPARPKREAPGEPLVAEARVEPRDRRLPAARASRSRGEAGDTGSTEARGQPEDYVEDRGATPLSASVRLRVRDARGENFGSGTIIDSRIGRTLILTCGHIFRNWDERSQIEVDVFRGERVWTAVGRRIASSLKDDVGLIEIPTDVILPACRVAGPQTMIQRGTSVVSVGCGGGEPPTQEAHKITALNRYLGADNIECTGVPEQGRSGGGLFLRDGRVIGVCMAADPRFSEGLYAGLKTVHALLNRCQLSHIYEDAGQIESPLARPDQGAGDEGAALAGAGARGAARTRPQRGASTAHGSQRSHDEESLVREALKSAGEAEVICVIRPIEDPEGESRVVVINRASRMFVSYLTDEMDGDDELLETTLVAPATQLADTTLPSPRPAKRRAAGANTARALTVADGPSQRTGPRPYRRHRSEATD